MKKEVKKEEVRQIRGTSVGVSPGNMTNETVKEI